MKRFESAGNRCNRGRLYRAGWFVALLSLFLLVPMLNIGGTATPTVRAQAGREAQASAPSSRTQYVPDGPKKTDSSPAAPSEKTPAPEDTSNKPQRIVHEGIAIEFTIEPVETGVSKSTALLEGQDAVVRFKVTDVQTGTPINGLRPSAWMDFRDPSKANDPKECRQKVQSFLQAGLSSRPDIDLNTYYILVLNDEPTISVIDPLLGYGGSKLLTMVFLKSPGEDWVLSRDGRRLFVTMPKLNQVAVVDTSRWRVIANVDVGPNPNRIAFQQDEKYLWVGNDASATDGGVSVIDTATLKEIARIQTGAGHHEIALNSGDLRAFVTNGEAGTLSIVDVQKLTKIKDVKIGGRPVSLAFSPLGKAVYVADEASGAVAVVGGSELEVLSRIDTKQPGLRALRFVPDGRYGFAANQKNNTVYVFDTATNRVIHAVEAGAKPDKISFTGSFAYIWSLGTEQVTMIRLDSIGKTGTPPTVDFPGGQAAPEKSSRTSIAESIVAAPEAGSVLVANPVDKIIYYYTEGMAAPMGSFQNYGRIPRAITVWDKSLRELRPGVYSTNVRAGDSGNYDVALLLDSPRVVHCFEASIKHNPALPEKSPGPPIKVQALISDTNVPVGEKVKLRFKVLDRKTDQPKSGLKDVGVLVFLAPGIWQNRVWAASVGDGLYEISFSPPQSGVYYVFVQVPSLSVRYNELPYLILEAKERTL